MTLATSQHTNPIKVYPGRSRPALLNDGCVLSIGAFDGLHLGHQQIIQQLKHHSQRLSLPSGVMTFRPAPAEFFGSHNSAALMSWREKMLGLVSAGADLALCLSFDKRVSEMSADEFVAELLVRQLGVKFLMIGDDFHFGMGRKGNYEVLVELGRKYGFEVARSETYQIADKRVSSTRIRQCLAEGNLEEAETLLGHTYQICGKVVVGKKLGRTLGFPTANISLQRRKVAMTGVFAVEVELQSGKKLAAVANLGVRPTVNNLDKPLLEVHLLDFQGANPEDTDLYGQRIKVSFEKRLRDEQNFDGLGALKDAINTDIKNAREWFSSTKSNTEIKP